MSDESGRKVTVPISRRGLLLAGAGAAAAVALPKRATAFSQRIRWDTIVIGAGVFGAWTARRLREAGQRVLLVDAWAPAHARASSGGESRMTRGAYGADELYTRMAWDSLPEWRALSERAGLPVFHNCGFLFLFPRDHDYLERTLAVYQRLGINYEVHGRAGVISQVPAIEVGMDEVGFFDIHFGALMARRAVQTLVAEFVAAGGQYRRAAILPPRGAGSQLDSVMPLGARPHPMLGDGSLLAERFVFACGPWLPRLFPDLLGTRIFPTRQEVFFFAPPPGDARFQPPAARGLRGLPGWADFNGGDIYYGMPDLEGRGFKIARDAHGPRIDPDSGDRGHSPEALADVRAYMARRFPALAEAPLNEARVCQYENSANGDLLIDRHPRWENVFLVGAGSGHGFKHGPAVGRYAAELVLGRLGTPEPRFSLATKGEVENREVH